MPGSAVMTTRTPTKGTNATKTPKKLAVDAEARALMANPVFRAMLTEAKSSNKRKAKGLDDAIL